MDVIRPTNKIFKLYTRKKIKVKTKIIKIDVKSDPIDPITVLLGLIFVNLGPPKILPNV